MAFGRNQGKRPKWGFGDLICSYLAICYNGVLDLSGQV